jgi:hypothetical protein
VIGFGSFIEDNAEIDHELTEIDCKTGDRSFLGAKPMPLFVRFIR